VEFAATARVWHTNATFIAVAIDLSPHIGDDQNCETQDEATAELAKKGRGRLLVLPRQSGFGKSSSAGREDWNPACIFQISTLRQRSTRHPLRTRVLSVMF
jgi:hypothetical protein